MDDLGDTEIEFDSNKDIVRQGDCLWNLRIASRNQKIIWLLLYSLLLFNVINLFLAGAARFNHSQGAGVTLFVFQLLLVVPAHFLLVYVIVLKKWMIVP